MNRRLEFLESSKSILNGERAEQIAKVCKETDIKGLRLCPSEIHQSERIDQHGYHFLPTPL